MTINQRGGGTSMARCRVCHHRLKRKRRGDIGRECRRKLKNGYAGIQLKAFEEAQNG